MLLDFLRWLIWRCLSLSRVFSSLFRARRWMCVWPVEGEMLLEGQWGKAADDRPALVATAPSIGGSKKGVVCIRLFKVVPNSLSIISSASSRAGGNQGPALRRHIRAETWRITSLVFVNQPPCPLMQWLIITAMFWPVSYAWLYFLEGIRNHYGKEVRTID